MRSMQFQVQRDQLLTPLQQVIGVVERRQTLPILGHVLVHVSEQALTLTTTDLEVELIARHPLEQGKVGETTLPARKLLDIVKSLPESGMLELKHDGTHVELRSGRSRYTLAPLAPADFPSTEAVEFSSELVLSQADLRTLIERTQFAMAQQDVRFYLNGMLWETRGKTRVIAVATDGHRLAYAELGEGGDEGEPQQVVVPRKGVLELQRLLGDENAEVTLRLGATHVQAQTERVCLTSRLIDGRFPDYRRVLPTPGEGPALVDRLSLREALGRAAILANEKYRGVRLRFSEDQLEIEAHNPENEVAEEVLEIEYRGEAVEIGFNVVYLMEALSAMGGETVAVHLTDANASALLEDAQDSSAQYVVMPMRL